MSGKRRGTMWKIALIACSLVGGTAMLACGVPVGGSEPSEAHNDTRDSRVAELAEGTLTAQGAFSDTSTSTETSTSTGTSSGTSTSTGTSTATSCGENWIPPDANFLQPW